MKRSYKHTDFTSFAAAACIVFFCCLYGNAQDPLRPSDKPGDIYNDLRAFPDQYEPKERPWSDLEDRIAKLESQKNLDFIAKLKKLYDSPEKNVDRQTVKTLVDQIKGLETDTRTKIYLMRRIGDMPSESIAKAKRMTIWSMIDELLEKT